MFLFRALKRGRCDPITLHDNECDENKDKHAYAYMHRED